MQHEVESGDMGGPGGGRVSSLSSSDQWLSFNAAIHTLLDTPRPN